MQKHSLPSSAEVKERVKLYFYCPSATSWPVVGLILLLGAKDFCNNPVL